MRSHRIFGLNLASDFPFANRLAVGTGTPDLTFSCTKAPAVPEGPGERVYRSPWRNEDGESLVHLDRFPGMEILRYPPAADFTLEPGRITGHQLAPIDPARADLLELRLLGPVLSYWLERMGIPALHASAVRKGSGAVAFLATHGGGKSSLAAALMRAGAPLLTDDVLPVEESGGSFLARPGYPQMRMEPDTAAHFLGSSAGLAPVLPGETKLRVPVGPFGRFQETALPLTCLYVAERRTDSGSQLEISPLPKSQAVIELVRHSFAPYLVEAAGLQPGRLDLFSRLVQRIPLYRLSYPAGFQHLGRLVSTILDC